MARPPHAAAVLACVLVIAGCTETSPTDPAEPAPAVILFIGDGMGTGALDAARLSGRTLAMETLAVHGSVITTNASDGITDSGAAATAYATGVSTYNGAIGVDVDSVPVETVLEVAESRGWATGLVATSSVTHATPAAFAAHVTDRNDEYGIALQMAASGVDVLIGGGRQFFEPNARPDGEDLLGQLAERGCAVVGSPTALSTDGPCLVGLLAEEALEPAPERSPSLSSLVSVALDILARDPDGFFLMVEGSQIDWAGHANDGAWLLEELADFDDAVAVALQTLEGRANTTLVVTADHETGGLVAEAGAEGGVVFRWATTGHTAAPVPLFAWGDGVSELDRTLPNTDVGLFLLGLVRP